jgi:hypothetical protein
MKEFFASLLKSLIALATSKKVITAAATAVAGLVIKDPAAAQHAVEIGMVLIAGQGAADWGKAAKAESNDAPPTGA